MAETMGKSVILERKSKRPSSLRRSSDSEPRESMGAGKQSSMEARESKSPGSTSKKSQYQRSFGPEESGRRESPPPRGRSSGEMRGRSQGQVSERQPSFDPDDRTRGGSGSKRKTQGSGGETEIPASADQGENEDANVTRKSDPRRKTGPRKSRKSVKEFDIEFKYASINFDNRPSDSMLLRGPSFKPNEHKPPVVQMKIKPQEFSDTDSSSMHRNDLSVLNKGNYEVRSESLSKNSRPTSHGSGSLGASKNQLYMVASFLKFLLEKYHSNSLDRINEMRKQIGVDITEKLTAKYGLAGKTKSQISVFEEELIKSQVKDEDLLADLKEELKSKNVLQKFHIDISELFEAVKSAKEEPNISDDFILWLIVKRECLDKEVYAEMEAYLEGKMSASSIERPASASYSSVKYNADGDVITEKPDVNVHALQGTTSSCSCPQSPVQLRDSESDVEPTTSSNPFGTIIDSIFCPSTGEADDRINKFQYFLDNLDKFGPRAETLRLPGETVAEFFHRLECKLLGLVVNKTDPVNFNEFKEKYLSVYQANDSTLNDDSKSSESFLTRSSSTRLVEREHSFNPTETLIDLLTAKKKVQRDLKSEDSLLNHARKLPNDSNNLKKRIKLCLKLIESDDREFCKNLCNEIDREIKEIIEYEKFLKTRDKYWYLWENLPMDGKDPGAAKHKNNLSKDEKYKNKKWTYKNFSEFMFSRDYNDKFSDQSEADDSGSEVPYEEFKRQTVDNVRRIFPSKEAEELLSFLEKPKPPEECVVRERVVSREEDEEQNENNLETPVTRRYDIFPLRPCFPKDKKRVHPFQAVMNDTLRRQSYLKRTPVKKRPLCQCLG